MTGKKSVAKKAPAEKENAKYAVFKASGRQYRVNVGDKIKVNRLAGAIGSEVSFAEVLLVGDQGSASAVIGRPIIEGATVAGKIIAADRDKKVIIYKKKRRKGYTKKQGHRQNLSEILIESINA